MSNRSGDDWDVPPDPGALIESMRAFGYSLPAAMADLIDNSISAKARSIDLGFEWNGPESTITVGDDGLGMTEGGLVEAMRLGSRSPVEVRAPGDLGRFGLGLKSAAWSQARTLTVVSRASGQATAARCWDLDHVTAMRRWSLLGGTKFALGEADVHFASASTGTLVVLEGADRLVGPERVEDDGARARFMAAVAEVATHLGMVFHRFLTGPQAVSIRINGEPVAPWDPFLSSHSATQHLPQEVLSLQGATVTVSPFVLPHISKLTADEHRHASGSLGWNAHQGLYIYRARRLLVAGGWLGLPRMQREEHNKLARIRVDIDNSLDEAWQIDVRKATARVPGALVSDFRRIAESTRARAAAVYRHRGKAIARSGGRDSGLRFVWEQVRGRTGVQGFRINRSHPILRKWLDDIDARSYSDLSRVLRLVEENLPIEAIVMDARETPNARPERPFGDEPDVVLEMLRGSLAAMTDAGADPYLALKSLAGIEPFDSYPEYIEALNEEITA